MNELISNRTTRDVNNRTWRDLYNASDLNRVEEWCRYLADELTSRGYTISITTKTDWTSLPLRTSAEMERIRNNIKKIKDGFHQITTIYSNANNFNYTKANNWEKILQEQYTQLVGMEDYYVYSGVSRSGQPRIYQNRFRHFFERPTITSNKKTYTPIVYLESTLQNNVNPYINTGVLPSATIHVVMACELFGGTAYCGSEVGGTSARFKWGKTTADALYIGYGTSNISITSVTPRENEVYVYDIKRGEQIVKDCSFTNINRRTLTSLNSYNTYPITLYRITLANGSFTMSTGTFRIHWCKIYDGETLIRDFIPVKDSNLVPCLYEKISDTFYYNQDANTHFNAGEY